jgi:hypothetical protein
VTTTASKLLATIADFRRRLLDNEASAAQAMKAAHDNTLAVIEAELDKLYDQMTQAIASGETFSLYKLYEAERLETIKRLITSQVDQFGALAQTMTGRLQEDGVHLGLDAALQMLQVQVPPGISWSFGQPSLEALAQLIGATQSGSPLADLFKGFGVEAAEKAGQALISGVTLGWNPRQIAPFVREKLGISRNRALVLSRNESLRCYRGAALETYRANDDVVGEWRWTCAKNKRTCIACIMMDGKTFPLSREFFGHVQDRCTPVPITKSWEDILGPLGIDTSNIPDTRPNIESGEAWFHRQDEAVQRHILGDRRYELWKDPRNSISLKSFVGLTHDKDWGSSVKVRSLKDILSKRNLVPDQASFEELMRQLGGESRGGAAVAERPIAEEARVPGRAAAVADLRVKYPQTTFEFDGVDPVLHERIARHIDELFSEYPSVARSLNYVGSDRFVAEFGEQYARSAALATHWSGANQGLSEIHLNPAVWGNAAEFQEKLNRALERGYIPPKANRPEAILTHEFGHVVHYHINRTSEAANIFQEQNESLGSLVSGYASTDPRKEAWAEAFSSIRHTPPEQWAEYTKRLAQFLRIGRRE